MRLLGQRLTDGDTQLVVSSEEGSIDIYSTRTMLRQLTGPWLLIGILIVSVCIVGLLIWMAFAPLAQAVVISGTVKVESNRRRVQHLEGGTVESILVRDGERVALDDVLVRLDDTRAGTTMRILQGAYDAESARYGRLIAERDQLPQPTFSEELTARQEDLRVAELLDVQRKLFKARNELIQGKLEIFARQIDQLKDKITGVTAQRESQKLQSAKISEELNAMRGLFKKGMIPKPDILALEREQARLNGKWGELTAEQAETEKAIAEKELEMLQLVNDYRRGVIDELREVQSKLMDYGERKVAAEYVLKHIEVRSPVDGIVEGLQVFSNGQVIGPGETILEIVPLNDALTIEAKVSPTEIDNLILGQSAGVRFTGFNQRTTPVLQGSLSYISADAFEDERTGMTYFRVRIEISEGQLERLVGGQIQPGMPAEVMINTGQRTVLDYLAKPLTDAFARAWTEG